MQVCIDRVRLPRTLKHNKVAANPAKQIHYGFIAGEVALFICDESSPTESSFCENKDAEACKDNLF